MSVVTLNNATGTVTIGNYSATVSTGGVAVSIPPYTPLNFADMDILAVQLQPTDTAPTNPANGMLYFDDGTNTETGKPMFRLYRDGAWEDLPDLSTLRVDGGRF